MVSVQNSTKVGASSNRLPNNVSSFVVISLAKVRFGLPMSILNLNHHPKAGFRNGWALSVDSSRYASIPDVM